jgi:hypothetical protein
MAFIRVMCGSGNSDYNKWVMGDHTANQLMHYIIGDDFSPSVYQVETEIEEARAMAAHYLLLTARPALTTISALRIKHHEITDLQIEIERQEGTTHIRDIDAKHYNLHGTRAKFEALFRTLYEAVRRGEDRVRVLGKSQLTYQLQEFLKLNSDSIDEPTKRRCERLLGATR